MNTSRECMEIRMALGAYSLGALEREELRAVEEHLAACTACAGEASELGAMRELLNRVTPADIDLAEGPPSDGLFERIVEASARERRRRRWLVSGAAAAVAAGVLVAGLLVMPREEGPRRPVAAATPTISASSATSSISATLQTWPGAGGTRVALWVSGIPAGTKCSLAAVAKNGARETAATWKYKARSDPYANGPNEYMGTTSFARDEINRFEIVKSSGELLLTLPL